MHGTEVTERKAYYEVLVVLGDKILVPVQYICAKDARAAEREVLIAAAQTLKDKAADCEILVRPFLAGRP